MLCGGVKVGSWPTTDKLHVQFPVGPLSGNTSIPPGSLNQVPASAGVKAGMSPLQGGRYHCVIPYGM